MYRVTKRFGHGAEIQAGQFNNEPEAKTFINEKLQEDYNFKILNTAYSLYEGADKLGDFTQRDMDYSSSSQSKGSGQSFQPSPFQTAPRPGGVPRSGFKDDENEDGKK